MKKAIFSILLAIFVAGASAREIWKGKWISPMVNQSLPNTWIGFRKQVGIEVVPRKAIARIAVDSKYWLWVNGREVVWEGGVKRGPNRSDTYYDQVDIAPYLQQGENTIAVLVWYFGKDGFSHNSSGKCALLFDCQTPEVDILSDANWEAGLMNAYKTAPEPYPNFRLSESSLLYDARLDPHDWQTDTKLGLGESIVIGEAGEAPWNTLHPRPIPFWKDYGVSDYTSVELHSGEDLNTLECTLPYDAHIVPLLKLTASAGHRIVIYTDNYKKFEATGEHIVRAEYITKEGEQEFEFPTWLNGHKVFYEYPPHVAKIEVKYRQTGYNADFAGHFECSEPFFNKLWEKAARSLYVNMRDTYMDCPDRERAQWTGDAVNEAEQAYYALSRSADSLTRKWLYEVVGWQKPNGQLFAPVPAGNWTKELSGQVLSTVGYFGLWNYYMQTGDRQAIADLYDGVRKYLSIWETDSDGTVIFRHGEWMWGDWGDNVDIVAIHNILYYHAVKGMWNCAGLLGKTDDAAAYEKWMEHFRSGFNAKFWNGSAYRTPDYTGQTDDRVQALAAVIGVAGSDKYPAILEIFRKEYHASPYMERYVMEALFMMGYEDFALERTRNRYTHMVEDGRYSTLFEGWNDSGSINHAWGGGPLGVLSKYLCGVAPVEAGYKVFGVIPTPATITQASVVVPSAAGEIHTSYSKTDSSFELRIVVPEGTTCIAGIENGYSTIKLDGRRIWRNGKFTPHKSYTAASQDDPAHTKLTLTAGEWIILAEK
jgi:hypothetical protein